MNARFLPLFFCLTLVIQVSFAEDGDVATLQASAAKGDPDAELALGRAYHLGQMGLTIDYAKAKDFYEKAAAQGNAKAMYNLGYIYHHAQGVPLDDATAQQWFQKAADKGLPAAQLELGLSYLAGDGGLPKDPGAALKWLSLAVQHQDTPAHEGLASEALGAIYEKGLGVPVDYKQALVWYTKGADLGNAKAQFGLACLYNDGNGVNKDPEMAYTWMKLSSLQGDPLAIHLLPDITRKLTPDQIHHGDLLISKYIKDHPISTTKAHAVALTPDAITTAQHEAQVKASATSTPAATNPPTAK